MSAGSSRLEHDLRADLHAYVVPVTPKMLRETLCVVEYALRELEKARPDFNAGGTIDSHLCRIRHLLDECDRKRPTGPDGRHGNRHADECGCRP